MTLLLLLLLLLLTGAYEVESHERASARIEEKAGTRRRTKGMKDEGVEGEEMEEQKEAKCSSMLTTLERIGRGDLTGEKMAGRLLIYYLRRG